MDPDLEGLKPSLSGVLMCTAHLRIPVRTSTNQGPENGNLVEQGRRMDPDLEGLRPSFSGVLMCTTHLRIPVRASANQGPEKGNLTLL